MSQYELDLTRMARFPDCPEWACGRVPDTCVFCFERLDAEAPYRQLPCQHCFHLPCIDNWIGRHHANCPLCRETFYYLRRPRVVTITRPPPQSVQWPDARQQKSKGKDDENRRVQTVFNGFKTWCKKKIHDRPNLARANPRRRGAQQLLVHVNQVEGVRAITH